MKNITVFGSFVVDLMARAPHLPEPGETVKSNMFKMGPGGKGFNQAIAAKKSGAEVIMVTKLGKDAFADIALDKLNQEGMSTEFVFQTNDSSTGTALIIVDENTSQNMIAVTLGSCSTFNDQDIEAAKSAIKNSDILLTQLETNVDAMKKVVKIAKEYNLLVVLNPAPVQEIDDDLYKQIDIITPNEVEASILTGIEVDKPDDALKAAKVFMDKGVKNVVITLGKQGVLAVTPKEHKLFSNYDNINVLDTTGAGDAFNGGFVTALSEGKTLFDAVAFGNVVANLSVEKLGTSVAMPIREEINHFINSNR